MSIIKKMSGDIMALLVNGERVYYIVRDVVRYSGYVDSSRQMSQFPTRVTYSVLRKKYGLQFRDHRLKDNTVLTDLPSIRIFAANACKVSIADRLCTHIENAEAAILVSAVPGISELHIMSIPSSTVSADSADAEQATAGEQVPDTTPLDCGTSPAKSGENQEVVSPALLLSQCKNLMMWMAQVLATQSQQIAQQEDLSLGRNAVIMPILPPPCDAVTPIPPSPGDFDVAMECEVSASIQDEPVSIRAPPPTNTRRCRRRPAPLWYVSFICFDRVHNSFTISRRIIQSMSVNCLGSLPNKRLPKITAAVIVHQHFDVVVELSKHLDQKIVYRERRKYYIREGISETTAVRHVIFAFDQCQFEKRLQQDPYDPIDEEAFRAYRNAAEEHNRRFYQGR